MDPFGVYKRYKQRLNPTIQFKGNIMIVPNKKPGVVKIERDPLFKKIKRCVEQRSRIPDCTVLSCNCNICVKVLFQELYNIDYEKFSFW
jgi:hypothetical protein